MAIDCVLRNLRDAILQRRYYAYMTNAPPAGAAPIGENYVARPGIPPLVNPSAPLENEMMGKILRDGP